MHDKLHDRVLDRKKSPVSSPSASSFIGEIDTLQHQIRGADACKAMTAVKDVLGRQRLA